VDEGNGDALSEGAALGEGAVLGEGDVLGEGGSAHTRMPIDILDTVRIVSAST
jgi:hypothetical protein